MARSTVSSSERLGRPGGGVTRVYLDYAGFSPVDPRVVALMRPFLEGGVGNPAAPHSLGLEARASLDGARAKVARLVGATAAGVIFTASATEANNLAIHLLTLSSNDLYGPPGAGALWTRAEVKLGPIVVGGGQEGGYRAGTENLPAIVGMGVAADLARAEAAAEVARLSGLRDHFLRAVLERVPRARLTGARGATRLPHHASIVVSNVKADGVLLELDLRGVAASSGSACNMASGQPSHVLRAIGCTRDELEGSLCFTLGRWTTAAEVDAVLEALPAVVERLRRLAP